MVAKNKLFKVSLGISIFILLVSVVFFLFEYYLFFYATWIPVNPGRYLIAFWFSMASFFIFGLLAFFHI